jgi:DNA-binding NarL/FixJ family response regulator
VEDHPAIRQGLEFVLSREGFRQLGSAGSAVEGTRMIRARLPDVALVDINLGDGSGTDLARAVRDDGLPTEIVLYTGSISRAVIDAAARSGARALVLKTSPIQHVVDAIRAAAAGRDYVDPSVTSAAAKLGVSGARKTSTREAQVLGLLARGQTTEQIADDLVLSPETVQTHVRNATRKLGARGRLHAVMLAVANSEIDLPGGAR